MKGHGSGDGTWWGLREEEAMETGFTKGLC